MISTVGDRFRNVTIAFLGIALLASPVASAQTLQGRTNPVELEPNLVVEAGAVIVFVDSDHDGLPDDYETDNGLDPFDASRFLHELYEMRWWPH